MANILIIGCGAIGCQLGNLLVEAGHDVTGVRRNPEDGSVKFKQVRADITSVTDLTKLETNFDALFFIVSADGRNESSYQAVYETGLDNVINWCQHVNCVAPWFFVSSTSVYGQIRGEWVDETSPTVPDKSTSLMIVAAERKVMAHNPANVIVRFSGIYGPGREYLLRMAQRTPEIQYSPPYYTNRIHQHDCVGVLAFLLEQRLHGVTLDNCYLASDDDPAPLWDVITWLTDKMQCAPPRAKTPEAESDCNKRCNNSRLKQLGYRFIYPNYRAGYLELTQ